MIDVYINGKEVRLSKKIDLVDLQEKYKLVFSTDAGREVLMDMLERNWYFSSTYVDSNPGASAMREGQRGAMIGIVNFLNRHPDELKKIMEQTKETQDDIIE